MGETQSLCPACLSRISARKIIADGDVYLEKSCPEHGYYKTLIWRGAESYQQWGKYGEELGSPRKRHTDTDQGCPYDCGLCPEHKAETCVAIMEVTHGCNLNCPICFASANEIPLYVPNLDIIKGMYETVLDSAGVECPVQLSGGEPTIRDDLPQIIAMGQEMGFAHIQVNTNGIRIAEDIDYLLSLKEAGASAIYLQFDGTTDDVYRHTRDRELFITKLKAIENCADVKIGVILVPTLIPGVNVHQIGEIVKFAKSWIPFVKGIHFQPISYFGRYPFPPKDEDRVTIPDVLFALEEQTDTEIKAANFAPRRRKESYCAFGGLFILTEEDELVPVTSIKDAQATLGGIGQLKEEPYQQARRFVSQRWRFIEEDLGPSQPRPGSWESFFKRSKTHYLSITGMPFQDVWNIDLERLKRCCTHVVTTDKRMVPLCAYYVTDTKGRRLIGVSKDVPRAMAL